jgi:hypothetical protein
MLEGEAKLAAESSGDPIAISWSDSGKAFRIIDAEHFSTTVLSRYFRTKKFSSFQRNLNLVSFVGTHIKAFTRCYANLLVSLLTFWFIQYGFAKVRRGPETDMYAHPAFVRGQPQTLCRLRKTSSSSRRRLSEGSTDDCDSSGSSDTPAFRSVSPSPTRDMIPNLFHPFVQDRVQGSTYQAPSGLLEQAWITISGQSLAPQGPLVQPILPRSKTGGEGRLDLLAMALEHEGCFAK